MTGPEILAGLAADGILTVDVADCPPESMCGGCVGSGRIRNPITGLLEPHWTCGGRGIR